MHFKLNTVKKSHTAVHPRMTVHSECESARHSIPVEKQIFNFHFALKCLLILETFDSIFCVFLKNGSRALRQSVKKIK